jgi:hypothetical protein
MQNGRPKFLTKAELRAAALCELNVSKNSFDFGWIDAILSQARGLASLGCLIAGGRLTLLGGQETLRL